MKRIKGLIIAAGNGSRLREVAGDLPKPLVELDGKPLLEHVLLGAHEAGIDEFVVVVGYRAAAIRSWFNNRRLDGIRVTFIDNPEYNKGNGLSVLKAKAAIDGPFLLLMSDHIFDSGNAAALLRQPLGREETILAVDRKLDRIFDMDDATKVVCSGDYVVDIGKMLERFDAVDTGMFLCTPACFDALEYVVSNGKYSLSDAMRRMADANALRAFDIGEGRWQDVDTPEALAYAETSLPGRDFHEQVFQEAARA